MRPVRQDIPRQGRCPRRRGSRRSRCSRYFFCIIARVSFASRSGPARLGGACWGDRQPAAFVFVRSARGRASRPSRPSRPSQRPLASFPATAGQPEASRWAQPGPAFSSQALRRPASPHPGSPRRGRRCRGAWKAWKGHPLAHFIKAMSQSGPGLFCSGGAGRASPAVPRQLCGR